MDRPKLICLRAVYHQWSEMTSDTEMVEHPKHNSVESLFLKTNSTRLLSCFRRGFLIILASVIKGIPLPQGSFIPDFSPAPGWILKTYPWKGLDPRTWPKQKVPATKCSLLLKSLLCNRYSDHVSLSEAQYTNREQKPHSLGIHDNKARFILIVVSFCARMKG